MRSLLAGTEEPVPDDVPEPECFADLFLDQVVAAIAADHPEAGLASLFHRPLRDPAHIAHRQEVFQDLDEPRLRDPAAAFTRALARVTRRLAAVGRMRHRPQADRWFLEVLLEYGAAVTALADGLAAAGPTASGLVTLRDELAGHVRDRAFTEPLDRARSLRERLGGVRYDLLLHGDRVTVAPHDPAAPFGFADRVADAFARFRPPGQDGPPPPEPDGLGLDEVETGVLGLVAAQHPGLFAELAAFRAAHAGFVSAEIVRLDRELRFYLGYLGYIAPLRAAGLPFCRPVLAAEGPRLRARGVFDLALAAELVARGGRPVGNDLDLSGTEHVIVVSGPNQGGKTTLSRAFGQLHHLAALGCPVPGREARLRPPDRVLTHYERPEAPAVSKLEDELLRLRAVLDAATARSVVVLNEIFTSTTADDARALNEAVLARIGRLGASCLWVSFADGLDAADGTVVSLVGEGTRSYRFVRRPPDGRARARDIAARYGLTREEIAGRVAR